MVTMTARFLLLTLLLRQRQHPWEWGRCFGGDRERKEIAEERASQVLTQGRLYEDCQAPHWKNIYFASGHPRSSSHVYISY
jgi:hypothetical protein